MSSNNVTTPVTTRIPAPSGIGQSGALLRADFRAAIAIARRGASTPDETRTVAEFLETIDRILEHPHIVSVATGARHHVALEMQNAVAASRPGPAGA